MAYGRSGHGPCPKCFSYICDGDCFDEPAAKPAPRDATTRRDTPRSSAASTAGRISGSRTSDDTAEVVLDVVGTVAQTAAVVTEYDGIMTGNAAEAAVGAFAAGDDPLSAVV